MARNIEHFTATRTEDLPDYWDDLAGDNPFLKRNYLEVLERTNSCNQEYHIFADHEPDSIVVTYKLDLDIFTYSKVKLKLPVTIVGIPCSVSRCGYKIGKKTVAKVSEYFTTVGGAALVLNSEDELKINGFARGTTLPTCKLYIQWNTFEQYLKDMRSHYRYRIGKALAKGQEIEMAELAENDLFDEELYELYLQVYGKSEFKLEKLGIEFFRRSSAKIITFSVRGRAVAFIQLMENDDELIFLFGGFDYSQNLKYDLYINMLLEILRRGIDGGCKTIDMGQTAEDTKMKLGCRSVAKYMYARHSNVIINSIVHRGIGFLSYKPKDLNFHVFRGG